jgi:hypothetical protein
VSSGQQQSVVSCRCKSGCTKDTNALRTDVDVGESVYAEVLVITLSMKSCLPIHDRDFVMRTVTK